MNRKELSRIAYSFFLLSGGRIPGIDLITRHHRQGKACVTHEGKRDEVKELNEIALRFRQPTKKI